MASMPAGTKIDEVADGIYRVSSSIPPGVVPGGFTFNQYLALDDEPLLFHTGLRRLFPAVRDAIARVVPVERLRWIAFSHFELARRGHAAGQSRRRAVGKGQWRSGTCGGCPVALVRCAARASEIQFSRSGPPHSAMATSTSVGARRRTRSAGARPTRKPREPPFTNMRGSAAMLRST